MNTQWLTKLDGIERAGKGELWLDPLGNKADLYECKLRIKGNVVAYVWAYEGAEKQGSYTFSESGALWVDTWHSPKPVACDYLLAAWGIFTIECTYEVPSAPDWGWRSKLSERPDGSLILQMTNIAPWGEEGRAVRMIFPRD